MNYIMTLVGPEKAEKQVLHAMNEAIDALSSHCQKLEAGHVRENRALDIKIISTVPVRTLREEVEKKLAPHKIDWCLKSDNNASKKLFLADMDSTMITIECIDELADYAGRKKEISLITEQAMRGELNFAASLQKRVALLKGLPESVLETCFAEKVTYSPGAQTLIKALNESAIRCVLVSGGFDFFTSRVANALGFNRYVSNNLEVKDGHLTGHVAQPICGPETKESILQEEVASLGISFAETVALGDGANDIPMITGAGLGVAYKGKERLRSAADGQINHSDLTALLYFLGLK